MCARPSPVPACAIGNSRASGPGGWRPRERAGGPSMCAGSSSCSCGPVRDGAAAPSGCLRRQRARGRPWPGRGAATLDAPRRRASGTRSRGAPRPCAAGASWAARRGLAGAASRRARPRRGRRCIRPRTRARGPCRAYRGLRSRRGGGGVLLGSDDGACEQARPGVDADHGPDLACDEFRLRRKRPQLRGQLLDVVRA